MRTLRGIRLLGLSVAAGALASTALLTLSIPAAGAAQPGVCPLLPILCPTTTAAKAPATTAAPATAAPPTTAKASTTTRPPVTVARTTTAGRNTSSVASIGDGALPASAAGAGAAGASADDAAPQLAGMPTPSPTVVTVAPTPQALSGLVATRGLPNDHSTLRVALSLLVLLVAVVAAAQLPASRRSPYPRGDTPG